MEIGHIYLNNSIKSKIYYLTYVFRIIHEEEKMRSRTNFFCWREPAARVLCPFFLLGPWKKLICINAPPHPFLLHSFLVLRSPFIGEIMGAYQVSAAR